MADLAALGSLFCHSFAGWPAVANSANESEAIRSSSELPHDKVHGASGDESETSRTDC